MPRNNYQLEKFEREYNRLSEQQRKAVDTIETPMVMKAPRNAPSKGRNYFL
jgi:hypothetical protein